MCPRNCYDSCPMLAYTSHGRIDHISGDDLTPGAYRQLCSKSNQILSTVYHKDRLLYPMIQHGRGTGNWQRISWDTAIEIIARKILDLKERFGSTLPLCLNKYSGNFSLLRNACEGMFNSLGPTTQTIGTPCFSSGLDAQKLDFGGNITSQTQTLVNAKLIVLWGVNPAWTAIHTMPALYAARECGAKIVVIDPVRTETANKADYYIQLRPGSDTALALLLLCRLHKRHALVTESDKITGLAEFLEGLSKIDQSKLLAAVDQSEEAIDFLTGLIAAHHPMHIWAGFGLQRHLQGGLAIRLIDALSMLTGNIGIAGGGVNFADRDAFQLPRFIEQRRNDTRFVNINQFSHTLQTLTDPPVRLLWIACRDLLTQDVGLQELHALWPNLELIVTADKFLTTTAQMSDIVLPVTTEFEDLDIYTGYFQQWLGINERAIPPQGETKSDLEIARLLTRRLNELSPGTSTFPAHLTDEEFLDRELPESLCQTIGIKNWRQLRKGAIKVRKNPVAWEGQHFATSDGKFHCCPIPAKLAQFLPSEETPFYFITPHAQQNINGQIHARRKELPEYPIVYLHPEPAKRLGLSESCQVILWNQHGQLTGTVRFDKTLPPDVILSYQGSSKHGTVNALNGGRTSDLGSLSTGAPGVALYDVLVNIRKK